MIEVRRSRRAERDELYELWARVFDEDRAWLRRFFTLRYSPEDIFIARIDGVLASALHALPASYVQGGRERPCSYIVGAATDETFRRRGLMGQLLHRAAVSSEHPITLFPAVRSFYEAHGYTTTSRLLSFPLRGGKESHTPLLPVEGEALDRIYRTANAESGYLVRDEAAWEFLTGGYETVLVEDAYAFISEGKATEAFALNREGAERLIDALSPMRVESVQTPARSPLSSLLGEQNGVPTPMGMSTHPAMAGVYIAEQY
ncbi:MAG TPA: GNAT family N-acetyltransferase [Sphaerochaeta sp.]|nr:GNAT family N-acetyltransferase [Sphaerochaeta sp.]